MNHTLDSGLISLQLPIEYPYRIARIFIGMADEFWCLDNAASPMK